MLRVAMEQKPCEAAAPDWLLAPEEKRGGEDHLNDRRTDGRTRGRTTASISRLSMSMPASEWSPDLPPRPPHNERLTAEQGEQESRVELK